MIDGLKPYPAYRDSGAEWLGEVPAHWAMRSLGSLTTARSERNRPDLPLLSVVRAKGVILRSSMKEDENHNFIPDDLSRYKVVRMGDLVFNKMKAWQGSLGIAPVDGVVSPAYFVYRLAVENRDFAHRLLRSRSYIALFARMSDGVRIGQWDLSVSGMKRIPVILPPREEQDAIVRFLDHADRRIRRYIRAKQKLIKLLEEEKQALLDCALVRGLRARGRTQRSGVRWFPSIPEHWTVSKLQYLSDPERPVMYGIVLPGPSVDDGVMLVKGGNCEPGRLKPQLLARTTREIEARYARSRLRGGDIVIAIRGGVGATEVVPPELAGANITQDAARIAPAAGVDARWLLYVLRSPSIMEQVQSLVVGATVRGINIRDLRRIDLPVPPESEQRAIADELESSLPLIEEAAKQAHMQIRLLDELRTRLTADVVTGKLDVREAAARLPDLIDEEPAQEPLDEEATSLDGDDADAEAIDPELQEA